MSTYSRLNQEVRVMTPKTRALTGIQPSGTPHLGNWLGAIEPALALTKRHEGFYFIASYHALTTSRDAALLRDRINDVACTWLALGLDPNQTVLWAQHAIPEVCELSWMHDEFERTICTSLREASKMSILVEGLQPLIKSGSKPCFPCDSYC